MLHSTYTFSEDNKKGINKQKKSDCWNCAQGARRPWPPSWNPRWPPVHFRSTSNPRWRPEVYWRPSWIPRWRPGAPAPWAQFQHGPLLMLVNVLYYFPYHTIFELYTHNLHIMWQLALLPAILQYAFYCQHQFISFPVSSITGQARAAYNIHRLHITIAQHASA